MNIKQLYFKVLILLAIVFLIFGCNKSNGQDTSKWVKSSISGWGKLIQSSDTGLLRYGTLPITGSASVFQLDQPRNVIWISSGYKTAAEIKVGSDTLIIYDSVLTFYENKIRYIKIKDKVYPLK